MAKPVYKCKYKHALPYNTIEKGNYLSELPCTINCKPYYDILNSSAIYSFVLHIFSDDIGCIMNLVWTMCNIMVVNIAVVSLKNANMCLDLGKNIVNWLDLRMVPDLTAPMILGEDWFTQYNPMIN